MSQVWRSYAADRAEDGLDSDLRVGGDEREPVHLEDDVMHVTIGPFTLYGTVEEWTEVFARERKDPSALADLPDVTSVPWEDLPKKFPVTNTD